MWNASRRRDRLTPTWRRASWPASRGPLAHDYGTGPEASWVHARSSPTSRRCSPSGWARWSVIDGDGSASVPFGRIADDPVRIGIIERDRSLPLRVLFGRIDAGLAAWATRIPTLTDAESARMVHPRLGGMPAPAMLDRFVTGHAEDHIAQLNDILAARG